MKYIIFKETKTNMLIPVIISDHSVHSQVKIEGCRPISAGFFHIEGTFVIKVILEEKKSVSLNMGPRPQDAELIRSVLYGFTNALIYLES